MKLRQFVWMAILFIAGNLPSFGQTIIVASPDARSNWCRGQSFPISWSSIGAVGANVRIRLMQDTTAVQEISPSTLNDGSFVWLIPATTAPGSYTVRVRSLENAAFGNSVAFRISDCPAPTRPSPDAGIHVLDPFQTSTTLYKTEETILGWMRRGTMQDRVSITLMQGLAPVATIAESAWNTNPYTPPDLRYNTYEWIIPATVAPGQYTIRVRTLDTLVSGSSPVFTIANRPPSPSSADSGMTVTAPRLGETWCLGREYTTTWRRESQVRANVNIDLQTASGGVVMPIARNIPNSGSFRFTPPRSLQRGSHKIYIASVNLEALARSQTFSLSPCEWQSPPTVRLIEPAGTNITWCVGRTYTIRWATTGNPGNVRIVLIHYMQGTRRSHEYVLAENIPDSGSFSYRVPTSFNTPPDQPYTCMLYVNLVNDFRIMSGLNLNINTCVPQRTFLGNAFSNQQQGWLSLLPADTNVCPQCVMFDLAGLNKLLRNSPEPYAMALLRNGMTLVEFGQLGQGKQLPDRFSREFSPDITKLLLQGGKGYELVFKDLKGQIVFRKEIKLASEKVIIVPPLKQLLDQLQGRFPLTYIADFDPACPTCLRFDLSEISKLLAPAEDPVQVILFGRSMPLATLGIFGQQGQAAGFIDVKLSPDEFKYLTGGGSGYELVFKNSQGKILRRLKADLIRSK